MSSLVDFGQGLNEIGLGFYAYDYPGYGHSEGSPTEEGCNRNIKAAWQHLTNELGIDPSDIIIAGQSVGSGPSVWLAENVDEAGLILLSPFTSIYRVAVKYPIYPNDKFTNIKRIANIASPLLIIHGTKDKVIPYKHSKQLIEKHPGPKKLVTLQGSGHNDMFIKEHALILESMISFCQEIAP